MRSALTGSSTQPWTLHAGLPEDGRERLLVGERSFFSSPPAVLRRMTRRGVIVHQPQHVDRAASGKAAQAAPPSTVMYRCASRLGSAVGRKVAPVTRDRDGPGTSDVPREDRKIHSIKIESH